MATNTASFDIHSTIKFFQGPLARYIQYLKTCITSRSEDFDITFSKESRKHFIQETYTYKFVGGKWKAFLTIYNGDYVTHHECKNHVDTL